MTFSDWLKTEHAQALVDACATNEDLRHAWKRRNLEERPAQTVLQKRRHWSEW